MPVPPELLKRIDDDYRDCRLLEALAGTEEALRIDPRTPNVNWVRCACYRLMGNFAAARQAAGAELAVNPNHPQAAAVAGVLDTLLQYDRQSSSEPRTWQTLLSPQMQLTVQRASLRYSWRGMRMLKNPFDIALYPMLIWNLKPATIIEIGSMFGGSALWMADLLRNFKLNSHIYSIDLLTVNEVADPLVTFMVGDARELGNTLSADWLAALPRPLLVIEDADHSRLTTRAVLEFFHPVLRAGEYVVVEDSMALEGVQHAIMDFLAAYPGEYLIDREYCDFFGYNATWCVNGYIRKTEVNGIEKKI